MNAARALAGSPATQFAVENASKALQVSGDVASCFDSHAATPRHLRRHRQRQMLSATDVVVF